MKTTGLSLQSSLALTFWWASQTSKQAGVLRGRRDGRAGLREPNQDGTHQESFYKEGHEG